MKKLTVACFLTSLIFTIGTSQVSAISISFLPTDPTVYVGDTFNVDVVVSDLSTSGEIVSAFDLFIGYDASILSATSVTFGNYLDDLLFLSDQFTELNNPGILEFGEVSFLNEAYLAAIQPDSFTLVTLTFDALAIGISDLLFLPHPIFNQNDIKGLSDVDGNLPILDVDAFSGLVTVNAQVASVPEPGTLLLLMGGLLFLALPNLRSKCRV